MRVTKKQNVTKWQSFIATIHRIISSQKFFYGILVIFALQAIWIACSAAYPMAFDESFHYGIIGVYADQWSPILTHESPHPGEYGQLIHDPSYLYHYLMSFPYRIIVNLFHGGGIGVLSLRFIDIVLFGLGLVLFRTLLLRVGVSKAITHAVLFVIVLLPVTSFLAGQVNYDNLLFCVVPLFLLYAFALIDGLKKQGKVAARDLILLLSIGMLGCLVKYAFAPIFAVVIIYLLVLWLIRGERRQAVRAVVESFKKYSRRLQIGLAALLVLSTGLFLQRYAYNVIVYHAIQPDCAKVLTVEQCLNYGPWARNYKLNETAKAGAASYDDSDKNIVEFTGMWMHDMVYRLYFTINYDFQEYSPMPIPFDAAFLFGGFGFVLAILFMPILWRKYAYIRLFVVVILAYSLSLFVLNFVEYQRFNTAVAINGRYLLPLLPLLLVIFALAYREFFTRLAGRHATALLVIVFLLVGVASLCGGGAVPYFIHSQPVWYWQGDPITGFNIWARDVARQLVPGASQAQ